MTISLHKLVVTGPSKRPATLKLDGQSHLVFGPTDTGKSYIVECFRYCLGGGDKPKDVGFSEGYSRAALQVSLSDGSQFTLFRDLTDGAELVYEGFHTLPPQDGTAALEQGISELLPIWCGSSGMKILAKSGQLGNLTAGDLRRVYAQGTRASHYSRERGTQLRDLGKIELYRIRWHGCLMGSRCR